MNFSRIKLSILYLFFALFACLIIFQALRIQLIGSSRLDNKVSTQLLSKIQEKPKRGKIVDRNGQVIAFSKKCPSLFVDPFLVQNPKIFSRKVSKILGLSERQILNLIKDKSKRFVWLKRFANDEEVEKITALKFHSIGTIEEDRRTYPYGEIAQDLIGKVNVDGMGVTGIEKYFDVSLSGAYANSIVKKDGKGRKIFNHQESLNRSIDGDDVQLSIDINLQEFVESVLKDGVQSQWKTAIVMNVHTGEILALGNTHNEESQRIHSVMDIYEPGSTVKPFTIAFALEEKLVTPETYINTESGQYRIGYKTIREAEKKFYFKNLKVKDILRYSSNIGSAKISKMLGKEKLLAWYDKVGITKKTGIELPSETTGYFNAHKDWGDLIQATVGYGHGMTITPLQLARMYSILGNGGMTVTPQVILRAKPPKEPQQIFSPDVMRSVKSMLKEVVESDDGTGKLARIDGFDIAGKTGTAKLFDERTMKYEEKKYVSSFAGFIPFDKPEYAIAVVVYEPKELYYGSQVAAPVFQKIAHHLLLKEGFKPNLPVQNMTITESPIVTPQNIEVTDGIPNLIGLSLREANKVLDDCCKEHVKVSFEGSGVVVSQKINKDSQSLYLKLEP